MRSLVFSWRALVAALCLVMLAAPLRATPLSAVVVFGDSLSDTGTLASLTGEPSPPYFDGRFSNGPVAVEHLATQLGLPLTSFAVGGATSGLENAQLPPAIFGQLHFTGLLSQVGSFVTGLGGPHADSDALYVVWAGSNDFLALITNPLLDPTLIAATAVSNLTTAVSELYAVGARRFLLPNLPDIGLTPDAQATPFGAVLSGLSADFNAALAAAYGALGASLPGIELTYLDVFGLQNAVVADPAAYGLTNTSGTCYDGFVGQPSGNAPCANPDEYFFWDIHHPTARIHQILGSAMVAAVPAPASLALALLALLMAASLRRARLR